MATKKAGEDQPKKANGDGPSGPSAEPAGAASATPGAARAASQAQLAVLAQYIKDLSFENPGTPQSLQCPGQNSSRSASM